MASESGALGEPFLVVVSHRIGWHL